MLWQLLNDASDTVLMENNVVAHFVAVLTLMLNVNGPLWCVYIAQLRFLCDADVDTDSCTEKVKGYNECHWDCTEIGVKWAHNPSVLA